MDVKSYETLRSKAKPFVAKMRKGETVTPEEQKVVAEAAKARNELWQLKPPLCYIAGTDVRRYVTPDITFDLAYKQKLRGYVRFVMKKLIQSDMAFAVSKGVKTLEFGAGRKQSQTEAASKKKAEYTALKEARKKERAKKKAVRDKEIAARKSRVDERKKKSNQRLLETLKKRGVNVSAPKV